MCIWKHNTYCVEYHASVFLHSIIDPYWYFFVYPQFSWVSKYHTLPIVHDNNPHSMKMMTNLPWWWTKPILHLSLTPPVLSHLLPPRPTASSPPPPLHTSHTAVEMGRPPVNRARSPGPRTPWHRPSESMTTSTRSCISLKKEKKTTDHKEPKI